MTAEQIVALTDKEYKKLLQTESLAKLHQLKLDLDDAYYNSGESIVPDSRYDLLKDTLIQRDKNYVPPVGAKLRQGENRAALPFWLGSADKITPEQPEQLQKWLRNNSSKGYVLMEKLDGVSCLLVARQGRIKLFTRGDGEIGADISYLAPYLKLPRLDDIAIRGELIMPVKVFQQKYSREYRNPRNMVSGLVGSKTVREGLNDIHFVVYEIVGQTLPKIEKQLRQLTADGFRVVRHIVVPDVTMSGLIKTLEEWKGASPYEIDGLIVQANSSYERNTSGNPDYMFAFKMTSEDSIHTTVVQSVEWNVSKWGQLKPVVIVDPVETSGITMSRATGHNAKYVLDNKIGPGAVIRIVRSKEVIPYIVEVVKKAKEASLPTIPYIWDKNMVNIIAKEYDTTMCVKLIAGFFAKLNIKHVSEATVQKMYDNGLDNLLKIVAADKNRLLRVPQFQDRSAERIHTNIRAGLTGVRLSVLLGASGVFGFGVGQRRMDALLQAIPNLLELKPSVETKNRIMGVEGFSDIMADKIVANIVHARKFVQKMTPYMTIKREDRSSNEMDGQKFVMTGFRDKKMEEEIIRRGGKVTGTVSGQTTGVIVAVKGQALTGKLAKAQELNIPIYDRKEFAAKLGI